MSMLSACRAVVCSSGVFFFFSFLFFYREAEHDQLLRHRILTVPLWKELIWKVITCQFLFLDLSSPEAPVCRGAPAGPVPRPASHVCIPSLPATHSESGGADPALWRNSLQNCATGWYLHREVQRQETRGKQDPVWAVGAGWDVLFYTICVNC